MQPFITLSVLIIGGVNKDENMQEEDLIKKLEKIELPEIEIQSHRIKLRMALLNSACFKRLSFFEILKKSLIFAPPVLASLVLLIILGVTVIQPKLNEAKALDIAKNNPEIKKLIEENNMVLGEVRIEEGKAYILLSPAEEIKQAAGENPVIKIQKTEKKEGEPENIEGAIIEVNISRKEVSKINPIKGDDVAPLADKERESAKEIAESEEILKEIIPQGAKVEKIQSSLPQKISLNKKDNKIEAVPQSKIEKKARVYYILDGKKWVIKVNLNEKRVEEIKYSSEDNNSNDNKESKGRD